ncbi:MAG: hypothetical protein K2P70_00625 [Hyphomonadaceae bacterium]|nr:hypothetical protein [Hyphomonadaceae bacterium]
MGVWSPGPGATTGDDTFTGDGTNETANGGLGDDTLIGNGGNDTLTGGGGVDNLDGSNGNDTVNGGLGADTLYGGAGADAFVFSTTLGGGNVDSIVGFSVVDDIIHLDVSVFTGIGLGVLAANAFVIGAAALDADDRIIYNAATGALFYDADGDGAGAAVQFATLAPGLGGLTSADFLGIPGGP